MFNVFEFFCWCFKRCSTFRRHSRLYVPLSDIFNGLVLSRRTGRRICICSEYTLTCFFGAMKLGGICNRVLWYDCELGGFARMVVWCAFSSKRSFTQSEVIFRDTKYVRKCKKHVFRLILFESPFLNLIQDLSNFYVLRNHLSCIIMW